MTAINHQKHYKQNQKSFNTSMLTHKELQKKYRHSANMHDSADIHRNNCDGARRTEDTNAEDRWI